MRVPIATVNELNGATIAAPCPVSWEKMRGDDRVRFCDQCQQHVYDLSEMTTAEALELIRRNDSRLCVQLYRRADGTVLTSDCPVGLRWKLWKKLRKRMAWAASLFAMLFLPGCPVGGNLRRPDENLLYKNKDQDSKGCADSPSTSTTPASPGR